MRTTVAHTCVGVCIRKLTSLYPVSGDGNYYTGGLITDAHGSKNGGRFDAIQIECPASLRTQQRLDDVARTLASCVDRFMKLHYCDKK